MKTLIRTFLLAAIALLMLPQHAEAQSVFDRAREAVEAERDARERAERDRQTDRRTEQQRDADRREAQRREADRREAQRRDEPRYGNQGQRRGNGPPFCANGQGHPVHGMAWCHEKGWTTNHGARGVIWERGSIGDVVIRDRRGDARQGSLTERAVRDVLGRQTTQRATEHGRQAGLSGPVTGRWVDAETLELQMDGAPFLRFVNREGAGRSVETLVARRR